MVECEKDSRRIRYVSISVVVVVVVVISSCFWADPQFIMNFSILRRQIVAARTLFYVLLSSSVVRFLRWIRWIPSSHRLRNLCE